MKLFETKPYNNRKQIVLVSGNLCSGKGTFCKMHYPGYKHIVVSDIVRSLVKSSDRSALQDTKALADRIVEILIEQIEPFTKVVVDGIRQVNILTKLEQYYRDQIEDIIWLDVPTDVLRSRFEKRADRKDNIAFDDAFKRDQELGIDAVEQYIRTKGKIVRN